MKKINTIFIAVFILLFNLIGYSQVTNLTVNGSSSNFTMTSGDQISWTYNVPSGASTLVQIWYDVNGNGSVDNSDVMWQAFEQTDGDTVGNNGPPDMNSAAGTVSLAQPVGLAPGKYIMVFTQNNQSVTINGTVTALTSPAYTVSGKVTPPSGKSAANIFVELKRSEQHQPSFWDAVTDANGNYSIQMTSDTAGNPWRVYLFSDPFPPDMVTPSEDTVYITGNLTGINFSFIEAAAQVAGTLKDENGNLLPHTGVNLNNTNSMYGYVQYSTNTNANGVFQIGLPSDMINSAFHWQVSANADNSNDTTQNKLMAVSYINSISQGDSIEKDLVIYNVNSYITGTVKLNGAAPGFPIMMAAYNQDSAQSIATTNSQTGAFTFRVTNKIFNYNIFPINLSGVLYYNNMLSHPGKSGLEFDISTTPMAVSTGSSNLPKNYSLGQNYPNPFNPTTVIQYQIPVSGFVSLTVYNLLGQKITQLVNEEKPAGIYNVAFNAKDLSSGIYFYKLTSGNYTSIKKMILLK